MNSTASTLTGRKFPSPFAEVTKKIALRRSPGDCSALLLAEVDTECPAPSPKGSSSSRPQQPLLPQSPSKAERKRLLVEAIVGDFGSREAALSVLDVAGNGSLSAGEFLNFLKTHGIRWEAVTGYRSSSSLLRLVGADRDAVDVYEVLEIPRPSQFVRIPTEGLIDRYMRGVQRPFPSHESPQWTPKDLEAQIERSEELERCVSGAEQKRKWIKFMFRQGASKLEILAPHLHGITGSENDEAEIEKVIRGDIDTIRQRVRSIEAGIRDFTLFRREVERCRGELNGVSVEQQRRDEEEKRRRVLEEQRKEMARSLSSSTGGEHLRMHGSHAGGERGKGGWRESQLFRMPTEKELVHYFKEEECVDAEERQFRKLIRSLGVSMLEGEQIKKKFVSLDKNKNGRLDKDEFAVLIAEMLGFVSSNVPVPHNEVDKYWRGIPKDLPGEDTINFDNFLVWFRNSQLQRLI